MKDETNSFMLFSIYLIGPKGNNTCKYEGIVFAFCQFAHKFDILLLPRDLLKGTQVSNKN